MHVLLLMVVAFFLLQTHLTQDPWWALFGNGHL